MTFPSGPDYETGFGIADPRGWGKGFIEGGIVYFPTHDNIFVFDKRLRADAKAKLIRIIDLKSRKVTGGNLVVQDDIMLIANQDSLSAFRD